MNQVRVAASWLIAMGIGIAAVGSAVLVLAAELVASRPARVEEFGVALVPQGTPERIFVFGVVTVALGILGVVGGTVMWLRTGGTRF